MAVVARGWSRTASTAVKLATAERIIGYQFKDVGRLYEALDQYEHRSLLPSGKVFKERRRNTRLALVGDSQARLYMAQKWYDQSDLAGADWSKINEATLSNQSLSQIGFRLGLDECASKFLQRTEISFLGSLSGVRVPLQDIYDHQYYFLNKTDMIY